MHRYRSGPRVLMVAAGMVAIVAAACGGSAPATTAPASEAAAPTAAPSAAPSLVAITPAPITTAAGPNGGVVVRWFIGIGSGGKPEQVAAEQKFAADFNAAQKAVYLSVEIYDNSVAANQLQIQIAAGNPPDIIGPVGVEGLNIFRDNLLDLAPLIASHNFDMTKFDPALSDYFAIGKEGATIGVPYATYPSFIYYNKKLFDEAKLPYPPTKVGDLYDGKPWDMEAVRNLGMKLTVDKNGNDATSADFDPENIVQWGFDMQWADDRADTEATIFGSSSVVSADGKTAQITDQFKTGLKWLNDGVWKDHFIMTDAQFNDRQVDQGFFSGDVAMAENFLWTTYGVVGAGKHWDLAAIPSYNGKVTAPLNADTFSIFKAGKNQDAAFAAMVYLLQDSSASLLPLYGGIPARTPEQDAFFAAVAKTEGFPPDVDWTVAKAAIKYADIPNFEAPMPVYNKSLKILETYRSKWFTKPGLNMDQEIEALRAELQAAWDAG